MADFNKKLSLTVPTYNRAELLDYLLEVHIPRVAKHNMAIFISDCASMDNTPDVIAKWQKEYPHIYVSRMAEKTHADENWEKALKISETDYTWVVGDSYEVPEYALDAVLARLNTEETIHDGLVVNLVDRIREHPEQVYRDYNRTMQEIGWQMICISCIIFHRDTIHNADFLKYRGSDFGNVGACFDYMTQKEFSLLWLPDISVVTLKHPTIRKDGWGLNYFNIMFNRWPSFVDSLPETYDPDSKDILIRTMADRTLLLGWRNMLNLRGNRHITQEIYDEFEGRMDRVAQSGFKSYIRFLLTLPPGLCRTATKAIEWFRRKNYRIRNALGIYKANR